MKIVHILNDSEIVIDEGSEKYFLNHQVGDRIGWYDDDLIDIIDPDTGDRLGAVYRWIKCIFEITEVHYKFCIAQRISHPREVWYAYQPQVGDSLRKMF